MNEILLNRLRTVTEEEKQKDDRSGDQKKKQCAQNNITAHGTVALPPGRSEIGAAAATFCHFYYHSFDLL